MYQHIPALHYLPGDRYRPLHEVQTVVAVPYVQIAPGQDVHLEGLIFDRDRNMYCANIYDRKIFKIDTKTKEVRLFYDFPDHPRFCPTAVKIHKDGRLFFAGVDLKSDPLGEYGGIFVINPDGSDPHQIIDHCNIDDLVFDSEGGFYYANYIGNPQNRTGTIEYVSPDMKTTTTVVKNLASPNGLALSPDGGILWVTETAAGMLNRIDLKNPNHNTTPYKFEGFYGPDSCSVDADGNLYVAMSRQGRIMVFNPQGFLIGQVITPGSEEGISLGTTHPMVHPDTNMLYFTAHDVHFHAGANIFCAGSYAKGFSGAYQFL